MILVELVCTAYMCLVQQQVIVGMLRDASWELEEVLELAKKQLLLLSNKLCYILGLPKLQRSVE